MASRKSDPSLPEPCVQTHSDDNSERPYNINARAKRLCSGNEGTTRRTCPSPTHNPVKSIVDKESSSESDFLEYPRKKRLCLEVERNTASKEKDDKNKVKENTETTSEKEHDDKNIRADNALEAVNLCDVERKPVSFSLKSKKLCLKDDIEQLAQTSKPKPAVHPSILAFQKLAKTVKWSPSKKKKQAQNSPKSEETKKVEGDNSKPEKKPKNLDSLRKIIKDAHAKENKDSVALFKRRKKRRTSKEVGETARSLVDACYHSGDEEDSTRSKKQELEHDQEQSVAKTVHVPAKFVSIISSKKHQTLIESTKKSEIPNETEHFVAHEKVESKQLAMKQRKCKELQYNSCTSELSCQAMTRDECDIKYAQEIRQFDEVTDMEVDIREIIDEITSFRGNLCHSWHSEISRISMDYDRDSKSMYYVIDTNILLHDIGLLDDLKTREIDGRSVIVVIPYVVVQELDGLKKSSSIGKASSKAIAWCNKHFERNDKKVVGQIYDDYLKTLSENPQSSADDFIRDCCLLMKMQDLDVVLLTNDTNLRNKALLSQISAVSANILRKTLVPQCRKAWLKPISKHCKPAQAPSPSEMMSINYSEESFPQEHPSCTVAETKRGIVHDPQKDRKDLLEKIETSLCTTLGRVLEVTFKEAYGEDLWLKIILHKPPWTLDQVLACWEKHWLAVFIDRFKSEVRELVRNIKDCLKRANTKEGIEMLEKKVRLLYKFFDRNPLYKNCVLPLNLDALGEQVVDSLVPEQEEVNQETVGVTHAKEMINLVGSHITHVLAMICDAFEVPHNLNRLADGQMSREDAASSAVNLHDVIMELGTAVVSCLSSATSVSLRELGTLLVGFWNKANKPCPNLPFTEESLCILSTSPHGQQYLQSVAIELERLLSILKSSTGIVKM